MKKYVNLIKWVINESDINFLIISTLCILQIAIYFVTVCNTYIIKVTIDQIESKRLDNCYLYIFLFCALLVIEKLISILIDYMIQKDIINKIKKNITEKVLCHVYETETFKIVKNKMKFVDIVTNDIDVICNGITKLISQFGKIIYILLLVIILFIINPKLLVLTIIFGLFLIYISTKFVKINDKIYGKYIEETTKLHSVIEEEIVATKEIIGFNRVDWEKKRYNENFIPYYNEAKNIYKFGCIQYVVSNAVRWLVPIMALLVGSYLVIIEEMEISVFVVAYFLSSELIELISQIYEEIVNYPSIIKSVERVKDAVVARGRKSIKIYDKGIYLIDLCGVNFSYFGCKEKILHDISFRIDKPGKYAFVGQSGSGKSTLVNLFVSILGKRTGNIYINGKKLGDSEVFGNISLCSKDSHIFPDTILNNMIVGRRGIGIEEVREICKILQFDSYIMNLPEGYNTNISDNGNNFSGGQKQILIIARALVGNPDMLIIDEATSALDIKTEKVVRNAIDKYMKGKIVLVIAHRIYTVRSSDKIFVIDSGRIVESGTHEGLIQQRGKYFDMIQMEEGQYE